VLRLHQEEVAGPIATEFQLDAETRHKFIQGVPADQGYVAVLGYYEKNAAWASIATSARAYTPPEKASAEKTVRFGTIPFELTRGSRKQTGSPPASPEKPFTIPPRVSWIPALGIEPPGVAAETAAFMSEEI